MDRKHLIGTTREEGMDYAGMAWGHVPPSRKFLEEGAHLYSAKDATSHPCSAEDINPPPHSCFAMYSMSLPTLDLQWTSHQPLSTLGKLLQHAVQQRMSHLLPAPLMVPLPMVLGPRHFSLGCPESPNDYFSQSGSYRFCHCSTKRHRNTLPISPGMSGSWFLFCLISVTI